MAPARWGDSSRLAIAPAGVGGHRLFQLSGGLRSRAKGRVASGVLFARCSTHSHHRAGQARYAGVAANGQPSPRRIGRGVRAARSGSTPVRQPLSRGCAALRARSPSSAGRHRPSKQRDRYAGGGRERAGADAGRARVGRAARRGFARGGWAGARSAAVGWARCDHTARVRELANRRARAGRGLGPRRGAGSRWRTGRELAGGDRRGRALNGSSRFCRYLVTRSRWVSSRVRRDFSLGRAAGGPRRGSRGPSLRLTLAAAGGMGAAKLRSPSGRLWRRAHGPYGGTPANASRPSGPFGLGREGFARGCSGVASS